MYTALLLGLHQDGMASDDGTITAIDDTIISRRSQNRDRPARDIDSQNNVYIVCRTTTTNSVVSSTSLKSTTHVQPDIDSGAIVYPL